MSSEQFAAGTPVFWVGAVQEEERSPGNVVRIEKGDRGLVVDHLPGHDVVVDFEAFGVMACEMRSLSRERPAKS